MLNLPHDLCYTLAPEDVSFSRVRMKHVTPFAQPYIEQFIRAMDVVFSLFILASIVALVIFSGVTVFDLFAEVQRYESINIIHNVAYIVVLLKAYKILTFYLKSHNLSIKYLVQISIIAPAIEVIFAGDAQQMWLGILFAVYSLANLYLYIRYHEELEKLNILEGETAK